MSIRDRASSQQVLAIALVLVMLLSVGGMGFIGGVGAQQAGGTADGLIADEEPVTGELGIASADGDVLLTGADTDLTNGNIDVDDDGSITVDPSNSASGNQFSGVTVTPNRVGVADGSLATGLNDAVDVVEVEDNGSGATPIVVIELAPQSNFSQTDGVEGTHDFIVIGQEDQLPDDITSTGASTDIGAYAVNNDNFTDSNQLAITGNFGDTIDALVGTSESDLQNENVDDFRIGAGTFGNGDVDVNALQVSSDAADGETVHSELIALDDGDSERYFSSVTDAASAAADGDTITVADGTYTDLENNPIDLSNNELTVSGAGDDTNLNTNVDVTGNNVTVEGFDINADDDDTNGIVDVGGENTTLQQLTVDQGTAGTGIDIASGNNSVVTTVDDVTVNAEDLTTVAAGDTGLALDTNADEEVVVTNSTFVGHQTQIDGNDNVDEGALLTANDFADADAQSAVARNTDGDVVGNAIFGSINEADAAAPADGSIDVSQGTYTHDNSVTIATDNVTVTDTDDAATVENNLEIASDAGDVVVTDFDVNDVSTTADADLDSLTFDDTTAESFDVAVTNGTVTNATFTNTDTGAGAYDVAAGDTVDVDGAIGGDFDLEGTSEVDVSGADGNSFTLDSEGDVTVTQTTSDGTVEIGANIQPADVTIIGGEASNYDIADVSGDVEVTGSATTAGGIDVPSSAQNVSVDDADITLAANDDIGVNITATGVDNEVITVNNTEVDGDSTNGIGINLTDVNSGVDAEYTIDDNTLTNFGDGIGVNVTEQDSTGREATISFSGNVIAGGSEFVGIQANLSAAEDVAIVGNEIVGADVSGGAESVGIKFIEAPDFGGGFLGGGDGAAFNNNTITGHARLIEDRSSGDEPPIRSDGYTSIINDLDNEFGTLVIGPDADYEATYGDDIEINDGTGGVVYLPGSISEAVNLVGDSPNVDSADLQVYETDVTVSSAISSTPDDYVDDAVEFPDADDITVSGESASVTANTTFEIDDGDQRNNHDIRSLTINSNGDAITVDTTKAQSEFTNLTVTADGSGVVTTLSGDDVNVIEVRDSTFDVGADGIVFSGTNDDRDGFVIDNVTIDGPGIGEEHTGLDLSGVEKPGKAGLPVNLTVTETDVLNFATQVDVGTALPADVDAEGFLNDVTTSSVTVEDNDFSHAVLVYENDGTTLDEDNLYGSVDTADGVTPDDGVIDVRNAGNAYDHSDTVDIDTVDVTVSGAQGVEILNPIDVSGTGDVVLETLTVDAPDGADILSTTKGETDKAVIGTNDDTDLTVRDAVVTTTLNPASDREMPVGIGASDAASSLTVDNTRVGVEGGAEIGTAVVAEEDVDLTVTGSSLYDGATVIDTTGTDTLISEAYGIIAGPNTSPEVTDTNISGFDEDGINTAAANLTLTDGAVSDNNAEDNSVTNGIGGVVTDGDVASTNQYEIDGTAIENNAGPGVQLVGVGLTMDAATVSENAGDGVSVDGDDVTISDDTTIETNDATGADLTVANATVEDSTVSGNGNGLAVDAGNDVTVDNNTVTSHDGSAVDVAATTASVTDNTVTDNGQGVILDLSDGANSTVTLNELEDNGIGLTVVSGAEDLTVTGNDIQSTDTDIELNDGTAVLDATLNYFGDNGPQADSAAGLDQGDGTIVYDPFLTTDQTDSTVSDIIETADFGHDVIVPEPEDDGSTYVAVGFPAQLEGVGASGDATVGDYIDSSSDGQVYAFNATDQTFETASEDTPISAFDALVIENADAGDRIVSIAYADDRTPTAAADNRLEFNEGLNFVAPQQAGSVDEALFPGGDTDAVVQPFAAGENLYGDTDADQVRDSFVDPSSPQAFGNFRSGVGDATVHPHVGYFVIVNEESNEGLEVTEQIPVPDSPTADNVAERTNADANTITNADTGDTYTDIQVALDEAQDGDTLRLGAGTYESAADPALVREDDLTITGAGATSVIDSNVTVDGDNVEFRDLTIVGEFTVNGNNARSQDVDVQANSPGDVTINGNGASLTGTSIEKSLALNGENARVSNSNVGGTLSINANNTEVIGTTRSATTVGANVDRGTLNVDAQGKVAFDLTDINDADFETNTTGNQRNVILTVEEDLAANDDYTVRMTVTGPSGSEVDLRNDDNVSISSVVIGDLQLDSQPVEEGNEFYIADGGTVETRSGSELNALNDVGSEGIEGSITFDVNNTATLDEYAIEMTVVQYDGGEIAPVDETGEATVEIVEQQ